MYARAGKIDIPDQQRQARDGTEFQIDEQAVESNKFARVVRLADGKVGDFDGQGKRIDPDLSSVDQAVQRRGHLFCQHVAGDTGQKKKTHDGVKDQATGCYGEKFLPQGRSVPISADARHA